MPHKPCIARLGSVSAHRVEGAVGRGNWCGRAAAWRINERPEHSATRVYVRPPILRGFSPSRFEQEVIMTDRIENLMSQAASLGSLGAVARQQGEEAAADAHFREAFCLAQEAANRATDGGSNPARLDALRVAAGFALDCGEVLEARRLMDEALSAEASTKFAEEWAQLRDVTAWPDTWLIAAVRRDPTDVQALDALADRYW